MKKLLLSIVFMALVSVFLPKQLLSEEQDPCSYYIVNCPNGSQYTVLVCDVADATNWYYILCGACPD